MSENTKKTVKVKGASEKTLQDRLDSLCEKFGSQGLDFSKIDLDRALRAMSKALQDVCVEYDGIDPHVFDKDAGVKDLINKDNATVIGSTPSAEKPKLEPIVQDRVARNRLPYKVSYGVSLASCGNTLPRASVVVEPKCFDMKPMCMCIQEISAHRGTDPQKDLYYNPGMSHAQDDGLDVVFTLNTNGVYLNSDLSNNSFSAFSFGAARLTIAGLFDVLKIYGFFEDFRKRTGYMTKCDAATFLHGIHIIPAVGCDSQLIMDIVMPGQYDEVLFTAIAMEYLRLFMVTWASRQCLPKANDYNANVPSFNEIFYINLITDTDMVIDNIWRLIDLINASRENDQKSEERTGVVRRENYE